MWAGTVAVKAGPWEVGIRCDTDAAVAAIRRHYADRLVADHAVVNSNYTIIAPHVVLGHGTLYRAGGAITESRRMSKLLAALDQELATLSVPDGSVRLIAVAHEVADGVVLEPDWRPSSQSEPLAIAEPVWFSPMTGEVTRRDRGPQRLSGVVIRGSVIVPGALTPMATPATSETEAIWIEALAELSRAGLLQTLGEATTVPTDFGRPGS